MKIRLHFKQPDVTGHALDNVPEEEHERVINLNGHAFVPAEKLFQNLHTETETATVLPVK